MVGRELPNLRPNGEDRQGEGADNQRATEGTTSSAGLILQPEWWR